MRYINIETSILRSFRPQKQVIVACLSQSPKNTHPPTSVFTLLPTLSPRYVNGSCIASLAVTPLERSGHEQVSLAANFPRSKHVFLDRPDECMNVWRFGVKNHKYTPSQEEQEHMLFTRTQTVRQAGLPGPESPWCLISSTSRFPPVQAQKNKLKMWGVGGCVCSLLG